MLTLKRQKEIPSTFTPFLFFSLNKNEIEENVDSRHWDANKLSTFVLFFDLIYYKGKGRCPQSKIAFFSSEPLLKDEKNEDIF